jgi:hypothetical protein
VTADPDFAARLRIRLAGKTDRNIYASLTAAGLDGNVVDCGYLDHRATVREQLGASVLLLPLRNDPDYALILPGKLFEYLAAGHPVLGIGAPDGAMARVLADTGAGPCCAFDDETGIRSFIDSAWTQFCSSETAEGVPSAAIAQYERKALTQKLAELLESVIH